MQCPSDAPSNAHPMLSAFGRWREIAKIFRNPRGGRTLSTGRAPRENSRPETHPTQQTPAFVDAQPMPEGMPNRCPTMPEVEVENYKPLNSPSTPTSPNLTHDAETPSPTPTPDPDAPATMDGQPPAEDDDPEHFPWHYTEYGVTCACGLPMDKDETCEAMRVAPAAKADPSGLVGGLNPSTGATSVYAEIAAERERAHAKHGATSMESQPVDDPTGMRRDILTEEIGEVAREFNDARHDGRPVDLGKLRKELIQVAAMATAWADAIGAALPEAVQGALDSADEHLHDDDCPDGEHVFRPGELICMNIAYPYCEATPLGGVGGGD